MLVLGIETSCDESSAALVRDGGEIVSNVVASSVDLHREYGGIVPEIAARAHVEAVVPVLNEALRAGGERPGAVAVTVGPGLVGSLVVGVTVAKGLAWSWGIPVVGVNHVEAHAYAAALEDKLPDYPFLALVVSGGHTILAEMRGVDDVEILGQTVDDALGEAYDKVSKYLKLGYPGGPVIDGMARGANPRAVEFPRPMAGSGDLNFSYSGLKTAVIRYTMKAGAGAPPVADVAASFQAAALEVLVKKTLNAALERGLADVVMGGGVACNTELRSRLRAACDTEGLRLYTPPGELCTDNAAVIAALGYRLFKAGYRSGMEQDVYPNLHPGDPIPGSAKTG
jgi:N6-L-threonylcarbamoyladenine synthase